MEKRNKKNKDKLHREKEKELKELMAQLVNTILGDESFRDRKLSKRKESVIKAIELLKTKEFAVKPLKSFSANEVDESPPNVVSLKENGAEESQSFGEELKQIMTTLEQHHQILEEIKGSLAVGLPNDFFAGILDDFHLPECGGNLDSSLRKNVTVIKATNGDGGTSTAAANEANLKLSPDETCIVQGYKVFNRNAKALTEIFQNNPNIVENFWVADQDLQSFFMNSLAEVYIKVKKSEEEMLELRDIKSMLFKVRDMELTGLEVAWLNEMLELQTQNYKALMKKAEDPSKLGKKQRLQ